MKRLLCNTLLIIIMLGVFCNGYFCCSGLSFSDRLVCYAEDDWTNVNQDELVDAFNAYCRQRNIFIEGSVLGSAASFTSDVFYKTCNKIGIDVYSLQSEIKKRVGDNVGTKFLFSVTGITAYNRIAAEFLQNYSIDVGDTDVNEIVESGEYFTDQDGFGCMIFVSNKFGANNSFSTANLKKGSYYRLSGSLLYGAFGNASNSVSFTANLSVNQSIPIVGYYTYTPPSSGDRYSITASLNVNGNNSGNIYSYTNYPDSWGYNKLLRNGCLCVSRNINSNELWLSRYTEVRTNTSGSSWNNFDLSQLVKITDGTSHDTDIKVVSPVVKPALPENEPIEIDPNDDPGGGDNPDTPDNPDDPIAPYDPSKPFPDTPDNPTPDPGVHGSPGSDGTITIPDFNFDIPDINWSLDGLQHKFPFSLPFDLYNACKLLNAEPETPELDYTIDLVVYDWRVNYDLHWLDPAARVIRIFELLAFVVGLILITRRLIGG